MKTLIFYLVLMLFGGIAGAQEITELKETKVEFAPFSSEVSRSGANFSFKIKETYVGEFEKDPLLFLNNNLNVKNFLAEVQGNQIPQYNLILSSSKGSLNADFNSEGEMLKSVSRFKNVVLPKELRHQLYREHKGWAMVKNIHITQGSLGEVKKDIYKIKLQNGKQRKNVTFEAPAKETEVVGS